MLLLFYICLQEKDLVSNEERHQPENGDASPFSLKRSPSNKKFPQDPHLLNHILVSNFLISCYNAETLFRVSLSICHDLIFFSFTCQLLSVTFLLLIFKCFYLWAERTFFSDKKTRFGKIFQNIFYYYYTNV